MKVQSYKDLKVWEKGIEIVDKVYQTTENFPQEERYSLSSQMQRAGISIPSNIAEGFCRQHTKEYKQFLHIALGSCAEMETQMIIAERRGYLKEHEMEAVQEALGHECGLLMNLIKSL